MGKSSMPRRVTAAVIDQMDADLIAATPRVSRRFTCTLLQKWNSFGPTTDSSSVLMAHRRVEALSDAVLRRASTPNLEQTG